MMIYPRVVGLDPSLTAFGIAGSTGPGGTITSRTVRTSPRQDPHERRDDLLGAVCVTCRGAALVVMEGLSYAAKGNALLDLAGLHWLVRMELHRLDVPYAVISPASLKLFMTGAGMADKAVMIQTVVRRFPSLGVVTEDECDALAACAAGWQWLGEPLVKLPQRQVDALFAVEAKGKYKGRPKVLWPLMTEPVVPRVG